MKATMSTGAVLTSLASVALLFINAVPVSAAPTIDPLDRLTPVAVPPALVRNLERHTSPDRKLAKLPMLDSTRRLADFAHKMYILESGRAKVDSDAVRTVFRRFRAAVASARQEKESLTSTEAAATVRSSSDKCVSLRTELDGKAAVFPYCFGHAAAVRQSGNAVFVDIFNPPPCVQHALAQNCNPLCCYEEYVSAPFCEDSGENRSCLHSF